MSSPELDTLLAEAAEETAIAFIEEETLPPLLADSDAVLENVDRKNKSNSETRKGLPQVVSNNKKRKRPRYRSSPDAPLGRALRRQYAKFLMANGDAGASVKNEDEAISESLARLPSATNNTSGDSTAAMTPAATAPPPGAFQNAEQLVVFAEEELAPPWTEGRMLPALTSTPHRFDEALDFPDDEEPVPWFDAKNETDAANDRLLGMMLIF